MRRLLLLLVLFTAACGGSVETLPAGTFAGSTAADQPITVEVGDEVKVNKVKTKLVDEGVYESKGDALRVTYEFEVTDEDGEELRCTVTFTPDKGRPFTEVIDLMML